MRALIFGLFGMASLASAADFEVKNEAEFRKIFPQNAAIERLATGLQFTEGPTWVAASGGYLVFSDIPANQLKKWTRDGGLATFRDPSNNANGNTTDTEGRLVTAEHGGRRIARAERDGSVKTLVDQFNGKKLNSPNDVVVKSDGTIWFTDPDYGIKPDQKEQPGNYVYRFDPATQKLAAVAEDFDKPNGLCFSPDETRLYIADSGKPKHIRAFDVQRDGSLSNGRVFVTIDKGAPDGIRCDADGRIWTSSGHGAQVFGPDGKLIVTVNLPEPAANLCFGGNDARTVFFTARKSLYSVPTLVTTGTRAKGKSS
jgi:gluconolactonase